MKFIRLSIIIIPILLLPSFIWADNIFANLQSMSFFTPTENDSSMTMLNQVFGSVNRDSVDLNHVLALMFKYFNIGCFFLGIIIILYSLALGVINTAHQGEFLGKKMDSIWVPVRSITGMSLIIPMPSGYSIAQIFIMWVIVQGVGLADTIWTQVIEQVLSKGISITNNEKLEIPGISESEDKPNEDGSQFVNITRPVTKIFVGLTCMHSAYSQDNSNKLTNSIKPYCDSTQKRCYFSPVNPYSAEYKNYKTCGYFEVINSKEDDNHQLEQYYATERVMNFLNPYVKELVYDQEETFDSWKKYSENPISQTTSHYMDLLPQKPQKEIQDDDVKKLWQQARSYGWAMAGAYVFQIIKYNKEQAAYTNPNSFLRFNQIGSIDESDIGELLEKRPPATGSGKELAGKIVALTKNSEKKEGLHSNPHSLKMEHGDSLDKEKVGQYAASTSLWLLGLFMLDPGSDVIIQFQDKGNSLINWGLGSVIIIYALAFITVSWGILTCKLPGAQLYDAWERYIFTPLLALAGFIILEGLIFAIYIPLLPFIIFTTGVLTWLFTVLEAIVVASIIAVFLIFPDGQNEAFGRAEPAIGLIASVFLRPVLMIFGLFAAIILANIIIHFFADLYYRVVAVVIGEINGNPLNWIAVIAKVVMTVMIYTTVIVAIINKCLLLINFLPEYCFKWVGITTHFERYAMSEDQLREGTKKGSDALGHLAATSPRTLIGSQKTQSRDAEAQENKKKQEREDRQNFNAMFRNQQNQ